MPKKSSIRSKGVTLVVVLFLSMVLALSASEAATPYVQTNLVTDNQAFNPAAFTDPNLVNPWGISSSSTSPFWVSNNVTGVSTLYNGAGQPFPVGSPLVVTIPPPASGTPPSKPTGQVFNGGSSFELSPAFPARFLFATEDGTISGWNPAANATNAILKVDNSGSAVYKGLAIGNNGSGDFLYAANFSGAKIDVFNDTFAPASLAGSFTDPALPSGYAPFNIQNLGGKLFVTYALIDTSTGDEVPGPGLGLVDTFDLNGNLLGRLISGGALNAPWGLALTPADFGEFSNALLVGNFGDGLINAFDPATGNQLGTLKDSLGNPIAINGLWGLIFGNGGNGGDPNTLYFTAGPDGETHGLFGSLAPVPLPGTFLFLGSGLLGLLASSRWRVK